MQEVRILRCGGDKRSVLDYNPQDETEPEQTLWLWGNDWIRNLEWDPREWQWRRIGTLSDTSVMNYTTKRGYRVALKQNTQPMSLDSELEREGYNGKARAKFFNRIWHPYLPRKVAAMQWLILTEGLPVGAWREKIGLPSNCELCLTPVKETLQHAFKDCPHVSRAWTLFRNTRQAAKLPPSYFEWLDISRGLMRDPPGPQLDEELRWDMASALTLNSDTPWDILRAQLLWSIWCQKTANTFRSEEFHLGMVLWHAWRNTIYCAMEAYKALFRHKRNEEKRQEAITCFQQIWTAENIFGRLQGSTIKWNVTPHPEFLPRELGAWIVPPIRINRLSPSPDMEAEFTARPDFANLVDAFVRGVGNNWQPPMSNDNSQQGDSSNDTTNTTATRHTSADLQEQLQSTQADSRTSYRTSTEDSPRLHTSPAQSKNSANTYPQGEAQHSPTSRTEIDREERTPGMGEGWKSDMYSDPTSTGSPMSSRNTSSLSPTTSVQPSQVRRKDFRHKDTPRTSDQLEQLQQPGGTLQDFGYVAEKDNGNREELSQLGPLSNNMQQHPPTDFTARKQGKDTELTTEQTQPEGTKSLPPGGRARAAVQPRSRPKRRCTKRLHHPSRKSQREQSSQGPQQTHLKQSRENRADISLAPTSQTTRIKPNSRPKRKCRFGPRARRSLREHYREDTLKTKATTEQKAKEGHSGNSGKHSLLTPEPPNQEGNSDVSNLAPHPDRVTLQTRSTPFDHHQSKRSNRQPAEFEAKLSEEIEELLREIEITRQGAPNNNELKGDRANQKGATEAMEPHGEVQQQCQEGGSNKHLVIAHQNKGYNQDGGKEGGKRGREGKRTTLVRRDPPPSPPRTRTQVHPSLNDGSSAPLRDETRHRHRAADGIWSAQPQDGGQYGLEPIEEYNTQVILPDRPTLLHFSPARFSPFDAYLDILPPAPRPPPFRSIQAQLGLAEFEARLTSEIDEVLLEAEEDRRS